MPAFSSDGRAVLVVDRGGFVMLGGGHRRRIVKGYSDMGGAWSPDGRHIAYTHGIVPGLGGDSYTSTLYAAGRRLVGHELSPGTPSWSATGLIAFAGGNGIYTIRPGGTGLRRIETEYFGTDPPAVAWSPDANRIAFCSDGELEIVSSATGRHLLRRRSTCNDAEQVAFSPSGRHLAFAGHGWLRIDGRPIARL